MPHVKSLMLYSEPLVELEVDKGARPNGDVSKFENDQRGRGRTDHKRRCPAGGGYDNSKPIGRPIAEDERVESVDAHRDDEEE
jgi:hypothetical protein